jgi:putative two-component system response regulator
MAGLLAKELGFSEKVIENATLAGILHDVGKAKIPPAILNKIGKLTDDEFNIIKLHPTYGYQLFATSYDIDDSVKLGIMNHHENYDGTGYPDHLSGNDIPLCARIMAVADVFDALVERRCYKPPIRPLATVKEIMEEGRGTQFDPDLTDILMELWPEFTKGLMD